MSTPANRNEMEKMQSKKLSQVTVTSSSVQTIESNADAKNTQNVAKVQTNNFIGDEDLRIDISDLIE